MDQRVAPPPPVLPDKPHEPTALDNMIWREMQRLYPRATQGIPITKK